MFIVVHYCLCHSDSASVLLYLIVSSLLTIVPFAVRGWYLSYVLYPRGERIHFSKNLYLQVTDIAGIHSCARYAYSSSASGFLGVSVGPSLYTVVCATVIVHQFFCMYLYYVLLIFSFSFNLKISTQKAKKNMCVYCHMLKKLGSVGNNFFKILFFITDWCWMHFFTWRETF